MKALNIPGAPFMVGGTEFEFRTHPLIQADTFHLVATERADVLVKALDADHTSLVLGAVRGEIFKRTAARGRRVQDEHAWDLDLRDAVVEVAEAGGTAATRAALIRLAATAVEYAQELDHATTTPRS